MRGFRPALVTISMLVCGLLNSCNAQSQKPVNEPAKSVAVAPDALPPESTGGFDGARAFAHVEKLVAIGSRSPGSEGIQRAQEYIRGQLSQFGCAVQEDSFEASTPIGRVPMKNFLVKIAGTSPSVVLLLTHYDTLRQANFVGANDSGSSTGLMLEMARKLCGRKGALTIWIAFLDGEEAFVSWSDDDSTYGSRQLAARLALAGELKRVKAVLLADMIGDRDLDIERETNSTPWLTELVWSAAARLGYAKNFLPLKQTIMDDHIPFLRRGVPAVDVIDYDYAPWHTPQDTLDKVSARSLGTVGHVFLESLSDLERKLK